MRIILIGQAAFGAKVLESLSERSENVLEYQAEKDDDHKGNRKIAGPVEKAHGIGFTV